ncbi:MAG: DUF1598 domain-containing protein [Planctomycetaceae bacterium]|jgi:hypothetical protein|nr:DUF1598 domain-containing protein [Planctomycetaceae bacterium]
MTKTKPFFLLCVGFVLCLASFTCFGQYGDSGGGYGDNTGSGNTGGLEQQPANLGDFKKELLETPERQAAAQEAAEASTVASAGGGIRINARGDIQRVLTTDFTGRIAAKRLDVAARSSIASLSPQLQMKRDISISLNRLEKAIIANNGVPNDEMRNLAGLLRPKYVYYYPDSQDIVISGPAEPWYCGAEGMNVGAMSLAPTCQLEDLVVALRAYGANGKVTSIIGCSIDPTQEGLARMQEFLRGFGTVNTAGPIALRDGIINSLGYQTIRVDGISPKTHAARIMVSADLRMKLIGFELEPSPVKITTFVSASSTRSLGNSLIRWYFVPNYDVVLLTEDRLGMEIVGSGVKLVDEAEAVSITGEREVKKGSVNRASRLYTASFSRNYNEIAKHAPVYAQLRNFIDMLIIAAHIQKEEMYLKADWKMEFFGNEKKFAVEKYNEPKTVAPIVNIVQKGNSYLAPTGGVQIEPTEALSPKRTKYEKKNEVTNARRTATVELSEGQWWW